MANFQDNLRKTVPFYVLVHQEMTEVITRTLERENHLHLAELQPQTPTLEFLQVCCLPASQSTTGKTL